MAKFKPPVTTAIRALQENQIEFTAHIFGYVEKGGTAHSATALGVDEHRVIKTLVMETESKQPLVILMHGDRDVSTKQLAREVGVKTVAPCRPETAERHTGYKVGGTSPFGTRKSLPVYLQKSILDLDCIYINGGARGFLVQIDPHVIVRLLHPTLVDVAIGGD